MYQNAQNYFMQLNGDISKLNQTPLCLKFTNFVFNAIIGGIKTCKTGVAAFLQFSKLVCLIEQIILHKKLHITWGPNFSMTK